MSVDTAPQQTRDLWIPSPVNTPPVAAPPANPPVGKTGTNSEGVTPPPPPPLPKTDAPFMNQEMVIDTSKGMGDPFEGGPTKLEAIARVLSARPFHKKENLALSGYGGACPDGSRLLVDFGLDRRGDILRAASAQRPAGYATLLLGIKSALLRLIDLSSPGPIARRLTVFTGHMDNCFSDEQVFAEINRYKKDAPKVDLELRFIGLGVSPQDEARLKALSDAVGAEVQFAHNLAELDSAAATYLFIEPALKPTEPVVNAVLAMNKLEAAYLESMKAREFDEAQRHADGLRTELSNFEVRLERQRKLHPDPNLKRFFEIADAQRAFLRRLVELRQAEVRLNSGIDDDDTQRLVNEGAVIVADTQAALIKMWDQRDQLTKAAVAK